MALNPKLLIAGGILGYFLLGGKSKAATSGNTTTNPSDKKDEEKGDSGDPVGPNGCKVGLVEKDGICVNPDDIKKEDLKNGGGGGNKPASSSDLIIGKDCKSWVFGDKTGDAWWKNKGLKVAQQWVNSGEFDPLTIAFKMIAKNSVCFKNFPLKETEISGYNLYTSRFDWINQNRELWKLIWSIRNRVDIQFFGGSTTITADPTKPAPTFGMLFGNKGSGFNMDAWWESIGPFTAVLFQLAEQAKENQMGPIAMALGLKDANTQKDFESSFVNVPLYVLSVIFPDISVDQWIKLAYNFKDPKTSIYSNPLFNEIQNRIEALGDNLIDLGEEGF